MTVQKIYSALLLLLLIPFFIQAQTTSRQITGTVRSGFPPQVLQGATVTIDGAKTTTLTDAAGNFILQTAADQVSLTVTYLGYKSQEVLVKLPQKEKLSIILEPSTGTLDEVVVNTGYQQIPKERATGSFVQLSKEQLDRRVSTNLISRIENLVPGLIFNLNTGSENTSISIRGQSTINSTNQPLIVIDNFPYEGNLNNINPDDVESITVLKDAAAASIWGARAGNGVIVITTKKGKYNQKTGLGFNTSLNIGSRPDLYYQPAMAVADYIDIERRLFEKGFYTAAETAVAKTALSPVVELLIAKREGRDADMVEAELAQLKTQDVRKDMDQYLNRASVNQQYALNLSGGSQKQIYYFSAAYDKNLNSAVGNSYDRITLNVNNTYKLLRDKLLLTAGVYFTKGSNLLDDIAFTASTPYALLADPAGNALTLNKYRPGLLQQAAQNGLLDWKYKPLEELRFSDNKVTSTDYRINADLQYQLIPGMNAKILYQYGISIDQGRNLQSQDSYYTRDQINKLTQVNTDGSLIRPIPTGGILDRSSGTRNSHNLRGQLDYQHAWGAAHQLNALAGTEVSSNTFNSTAYRLYGYNDDYATSKLVDYISTFKSYINPSSTNNKILNTDSHKELTDHYLSWYANAAYTYAMKYTVSGSARLDKSNLFGVTTNQKGVPLYSAGLSWLMSAEPFYQINWLPYLKLKLTYGYNGNINKSVTAFTTARILPSLNAANNQTYAQIQNPPNPELRWERVKIINAAIDFESRGALIRGSIEYFQKTGIDLIGSTPFAPATGISSFTGNYANTKGHGLELNLHSRNLNTAIKWNSNLLFSYVKDRVSHYAISPSGVSLIQSGSGSGGIIPLEGRPLFALYSYAGAGLDPATGDPQGYLNGEGSKDYAKIIAAASPDNIVYHGPARPPVFGSLMNSFAYQGFSLSVNLSFKLGYFYRENSISYGTNQGLSSGHGDYSKRWQNPGDEAFTRIPSVPAATNANRDNFYRNSSVLVKKADHIRLQDINFGYDFFHSKNRGPKAKIFMYMNNLAMIWKAADTRLDPDYAQSIYPPVRTIALGLKIEL